MKFQPHLYFDGYAEQALEFYKDILKGKVTSLHRFSEVKDNLPTKLKDKEDYIFYAILSFGETELLVSDTLAPINVGSNAVITLTFDDEKEQERIYEKLKENGSVIIPLKYTFWGVKFAKIIDKFEVYWQLYLKSPNEK